MLTLLCSPNAKTRTESLTNAVRDDVSEKRRACLLVPDQQVYLSEKHFADALPSNAGRYFEIFGFSGLADAAFRKYGGPTPSQIGNTARALFMWDTLRELTPVLHRYGANGRHDTALISKFLSAVTELESNGISSDALEHAAATLPSDNPLREKAQDLAAVCALFAEKSHRTAGPTSSERLSLLAKKLQSEHIFEKTAFYVDSFTGFTYPEYEVLRELMRGGRQVTVALCTDRPFSRAPHFSCISETAQRLMRIATEVGAEVRQIQISERLDERPPALTLLGERLWDFSARPSAPIPDDGTVTLFRTADRYDEAACCAEQILNLAADGYRFGEIAVLVRDTESVRGILDAALEEYGIPCFFSERTELASKPLSRLILSAVRAACGGYRVQDIMTLVKTGLTGADLRDIALFEEYCETWHISGKRFLDDAWDMNPDGLTECRSERAEEILAAANRVRTIVMTPLTAFASALKRSDLLSDRCRAVYRYLSDLSISEQLARQAEQELELGQIKEAGETLRLYRFAVGCLSEMTELLPGAQADDDAFFTVLSLFFADADLGSVPNRHDCVTVGSAATARFGEVRAVFLLGVCEGEFPRAVADDGILSDGDKDALAPLGIQFDTRQTRQNVEELFYVWRAVTMPSEKLVLSCPLAESDGTKRTPSLAFTRTARLLGISPLDRAPKRSGSHHGVAQHLRAKPLAEQTVLHLSQSSIGDFVNCPYRYYSTHILRLRGKKDSKIGAADEGTFLHFVCEQLLRLAYRDDGTLNRPTDEEIPAMIDRIVGDYLARVCPIPPERMDARLLHLFARLRDLARLMLRDIFGELANSRFTPSAFEQVIGGREENALPSVSFHLKQGGKVTLTGKVDRIDIWEHNGKTVVRVVDYKSGDHKFSLDEVRSGEDLQLVLYLFAALAPDPEHRVPGGAEFLYATKTDGHTSIARSGFLWDNAEVRAAADSTPNEQYTDKRQLLSCSSEELETLMQEMRAAVCTVSERILSGEAHKTPSEKACRFCPVADCCDQAIRSRET